MSFALLLFAFLPLSPANANTYDTHVSVEALCIPGYTKYHRKISRKMRDRVYNKFNLPHGQRKGWVIDHRIPLELGGTNNILNLYPQPKAEASVKDDEENRLHAQVCSGQITLAAARATILHDWPR